MVERSMDEVPVSDRVITAVADAKDMEPMELDPLYGAIDPDALDALYEQSGLDRTRSPKQLKFTYCGCEVVIDNDATITVSAPVPKSTGSD